VVFSGEGVQASSERSAFARLSAVLGDKDFSIQAFVQGDAGQMQTGTDVREFVSMQLGAFTRF
jgi:hypothetical protein